MSRSRAPFLLSLVALLLLLAALVLFMWAVTPPRLLGGVILPAGVGAVLLSGGLVIAAAVKQRRLAGRRSWFVTGAVLIACVGVALTPVALHLVCGLSSWLCNQKIANLAVSLQMYDADYDTLPDGSRWCDAIASREPRVEPWWFVCPLRPDIRCGYAFNAALSGVSLADIPDPTGVILLFESDAGWNACGGAELLPEKPRHGGADLYADGVGVARVRTRDDTTDGVAARWDPYPSDHITGRGKPLPNDARGKAGSDLLPNE